MPPAASAVPLDREALATIARMVRDSLLRHSPKDRHQMFLYALGVGSTDTLEAEWLSEQRITTVVDRTLRMTFRALQIAATADGYNFPIIENGKLTLYGQNAALTLPMSVYDCGNRTFFDALDRVAPHYLS